MSRSIERELRSAAADLALAVEAFRTRSDPKVKRLRRVFKESWKDFQAKCSHTSDAEILGAFLRRCLIESARAPARYMTDRCASRYLVAEIHNSYYEFIWLSFASEIGPPDRWFCQRHWTTPFASHWTT